MLLTTQASLCKP